MSRVLPALLLGLAIVGCSRSSDSTAPAPNPKISLNSKKQPGNGDTVPKANLDPATAAAQEQAIAFVTGMKGKVRQADGIVVEVNLSFQPVTDSQLKELAQLPHLTNLNLGYTQVTDSGLKELAPLKNLTTLSLRGTKVTGVGFRSLTKLKNFSTLDLRATPVNDAGLREIGGLKSLTSLDLVAIMGSIEAVDDLARALPRCKIEKIQ